MSRDLRTKTRKRPNAGTIERLLDAAERLFAEHGYDAVGIRQLVGEAKVNLGAVTYHFGSKEALFIETFMRRFRPANTERHRSLREAEAFADGRPLSVEKIVECMICPPFRTGLEYPVFHLFLARNLFKPPPFLHAAIQKELAPSVAAFIAALCRSLPDLSENLIHLRTMWAMGALLMFSLQAGKIPGMHNKKIHEPLLREMVRFISAGLQSETALPADKRPRFLAKPLSRLSSL